MSVQPTAEQVIQALRKRPTFKRPALKQPTYIQPTLNKPMLTRLSHARLY